MCNIEIRIIEVLLKKKWNCRVSLTSRHNELPRGPISMYVFYSKRFYRGSLGDQAWSSNYGVTTLYDFDLTNYIAFLWPYLYTQFIIIFGINILNNELRTWHDMTATHPDVWLSWKITLFHGHQICLRSYKNPYQSKG